MPDCHICAQADGFTYEREAITQWLAGHSTSPMTGEPLDSKVLVANRALRKVICAWQTQ